MGKVCAPAQKRQASTRSLNGPGGAAGATGATGPTGASGATGPGVIALYDAALAIAFNLRDSTIHTVLMTESIPAGTYLIGAVALIQDASNDAYINIALAAGGLTFSAGSAFVPSGASVSIALPPRQMLLGGLETVDLLVQSSDTHAVVQAENGVSQVNATYITVLRIS